MSASKEVTDGLHRAVLIYSAGVNGRRMPITTARASDARQLYSLGIIAGLEEIDAVKDVVPWLATWLKQL